MHHLYKESGIDQRLHWYDPLFNSRLKRMHDNRDRGHITLDNGGEVRRRKHHVSIEGGTGCGETTDVSESDGPLGELHASGISVVARHKRVR
jgi:hypothetical protein